MSTKLKILFLINPISGVGKKAIIPKLIDKYLDLNKFKPTIEYTEYRGHGFEISAEKHKDYDCIVAIGGDGTVNEVGSGLINTDTALAIIPTGSGNGLARHLNIPLKLKKAIININSFKISAIDTGLVNDIPFLGTCGFGFDAHIAQKFDEYHKRGFLGYAKIVKNEFKNYTPLTYLIEKESKQFEKKSFMFSVANSSQFGNGFTISPNSIIDDGVFETVFLDKFKYKNAIKLGRQFFNKKINNSEFYNFESFTKSIKFEVLNKKDVVFHVDGEPKFGGNQFEIKIIKQSLKVVC
jgi:YegS/Rv2252/BmrU family lipid kinase